MEEIVGLGNASDIWRGWIGQGNLHLSLRGGARRPRPRREHHHVSARRRRRGRQGGLDAGLGGRRDEMHKECVAAGLEVTFPPTDMRGTSARCTFAIRMGTCSGSAADSRPESRDPKHPFVGQRGELGRDCKEPDSRAKERGSIMGAHQIWGKSHAATCFCSGGVPRNPQSAR